MQLFFNKKTFFLFCAVGTVFSFLAFITAIRGISFGVWPQSETTMLSLHACAFLVTIGLLGLTFLSKIPTFLYRKNLVFIPLLMAVFSVILLPFHDLPIRSFLGVIRTGEGVLWWYDLSVFTASALLMFRFPFWKKVLTLTAILSLIICATLSISHVAFEHYYAPLYFKDYLAFAFICFIPLAYQFSNRIKNHGLFFVIFYGALNTALYLTDNKAMIGFGLVMPLFFLGLWTLTRNTTKYKQILSLSTLVAIPVAILIFFLGLTALYAEDGFYAFSHSGLFRTVASRAYLVNMAFQALADTPISFLTGNGWGSYVDHIATQQPTAWMDFTNFQGAQWDGITFDHFHSHNMFADTLNAIGILGFVGLILYILSFPLSAKKQSVKPAILFSAGFCVWGSFWFLMPILIPFLVFAAVSVSGGQQAHFIKKISLNRPVLKITFITASLAFIICVPILFATAKQTDHYDPLPLSVSEAKSNCVADYNDFGAGGLHLSSLILDRLRYTIDLADIDPKNPEKESPESIPNHIQSLNNYFCQASLYMNEHAYYQRLLLSHIMMRGEILLGLGDYIDEETRVYYHTGWTEELSLWLNNNPKRTDIAVPFFLYNVMNNQEKLSLPILKLISDEDKNNPIALWFYGLHNLQSDDTITTGINQMRLAFTNGIERFVPVDEGTKALLTSQ